MAEPLGHQSVFFAGEATTRRWPATVHGAYMSGVREARRIAGLWAAACQYLQSHGDTDGLRDAGCNETPPSIVDIPLIDVLVPFVSKRAMMSRSCVLCGLGSRGLTWKTKRPVSLGPLLRVRNTNTSTKHGKTSSQNIVVHRNCALHSPDVWIEDDSITAFISCKLPACAASASSNVSSAAASPCAGVQHKAVSHTSASEKWRGVRRAITASRACTCSAKECLAAAVSSDTKTSLSSLSYARRGATIRCHFPACGRMFHLPCALQDGVFPWNFDRPDEGKYFLCADHRGEDPWRMTPPVDSTLLAERGTVQKCLSQFLNSDE